VIFEHGEGDKVVKYERMGECRHCGNCCRVCDEFYLTALRDIKKGETILPGKDMRSLCAIYLTEQTEKGCTPTSRHGYPFSPFSTLEGCGFYWLKRM
jgi:hypothetical protein